MTRDHALGAIIGCAVGDALGTTLEFRTNPSADQSQWHTELTGGGPFGLVAGGCTCDWNCDHLPVFLEAERSEIRRLGTT